MDKGFIKLNRKSFAHKFWTKARVLSEFEAWIDLIQSARYDGAVTIEYIDGREIKYGRGQYPASIRFLAKKWTWGEKKVRAFLDELKKDGSITTDSSQGMNVITLCKFDKYNSTEYIEDTAKDTVKDTDISMILKELQELKAQIGTHQKTQIGHSKGTNNKKVKKENNNSIKESPNGDKKETEVSSPTHPDFEKFNEWIKKAAPYCSNTKNFPSQITEKEFFKLKEDYTSRQIADTVEQIENRKDLRKRYTNLYRTVLNWAKKEYGKNKIQQEKPAQTYVIPD
ncbi:hypothetical protein [Dysgonomonas macrotermitis]|uniref:Uncharacterized protein n=1 Tax=Dysgonomonas macrotermitis TaxID=1346286 RepID=A0A1M5IY65_9BACT|nr:hypothetical protein [Dysgonomonas macrotermitis]SHG32989.1 hypothetical protein SAMN05444362_12149 [Dysgonomonas macrotermitis]